MDTEGNTDGARSRYAEQVAGDGEIRHAVHELRKVKDDVAKFVGGADDTDGRFDGDAAVYAADRRYERVAGDLNRRVFGEVKAWMQEAHDQGALVLALGTSGVDVGEGRDAEEGARFGETGEYGRRGMVEVVEVVLMGLDGTVVYRQRVRPEYVPGGELQGTEYHGLTLEDLIGAPSFAEVARGLRTAAEGRRVIAYNAPWAAKVLASECVRSGVSEPVPDMGDDDCVMLQRSRFAGQYMVSLGEHRRLPLGSPDTTPEGVARTVCDVLEGYRTGDAGWPPEHAYDPWRQGDWELREHRFGWKDGQKPADHETEPRRPRDARRSAAGSARSTRRGCGSWRRSRASQRRRRAAGWTPR